MSFPSTLQMLKLRLRVSLPKEIMVGRDLHPGLVFL